MTKTEVILCDECKERVARYKCVFCGKDICPDSSCINFIYPCIKDSSNSLSSNFANINFCISCNSKFGRIIRLSKTYDNGKLQSTISSFIIDFLKKTFVAEGILKDEK